METHDNLKWAVKTQFDTTTFLHLSGKTWISRRQKRSYFEPKHQLTHFFTSSKLAECCSTNSCVIDRNKWHESTLKSNRHKNIGKNYISQHSLHLLSYTFTVMFNSFDTVELLRMAINNILHLFIVGKCFTFTSV